METFSGEDSIDVGGVSVSHIGDIDNDTTMLTRIELSLACFCEKVANLGIFVMHLETLECELDGLVMVDEGNDMDMECFTKGMEFDLLCGVLGSEVRELDVFLGTLRDEVAYAREKASTGSDWEERLVESEQCLKQSEEQFSEIKEESVSFQRTLSSYKREENVTTGNVEGGGIVQEDDQPSNINTGLNMQTFEEQRNILRMLEKSLASEIVLEKNFNDSKQIEENQKQRIVSLEEELTLMEEEAADVWERWFEADNAREILMGITKELLARLKMCQFNFNGLSQRESELRAKLETSIEKLNSRDGSGTSESVELLKRQLKESDLRLQHAVASAEASQEKQKMLYSTVEDMEHVIKDLKSNVSKAESRADSAEEKCIILSESNADLNDEVNFLRSRLDSLEGSLHEMEEAKILTAKDIGQWTKIFKTSVTQLAFERERLNKQLSSLASENKILVVKLKQVYKDPSQEDSATLSPEHEANKTWKNSSANDDDIKSDSMPDAGTVRRIDAGVLNLKHLFISLFVLLLSAVAYLYFMDLDISL